MVIGKPGLITLRELGNTLLETVFTLVLVVALLGLLGGSLVQSQNAMTEIGATATVREVQQKVLERLVWELRFAEKDSIVLDLPADAHSITFIKLAGWETSAPAYSIPQTISFVFGRVTLNGVTIAEGVTDLTFNQNGNLVTAAIKVEKNIVVGGYNRTISSSSMVEVCL